MRRFMMMAVLVCCSGCVSMPADDQLYRDLGGQPGVEKIVDGLLDNIAGDDRIFDQFKEADIDRLRSKLIEQICAISGGPCVYSGDSMEKSHDGKHITEAHFNALVEDLILAMEKQRVPVAAQNRLLAKLAPMRPQIINR